VSILLPLSLYISLYELSQILCSFFIRIPFRLKLDPHSSFSEILIQVTQMSTRTKKCANISLPPIFYQNTTNMLQPFFNTHFDFRTTSSDLNKNTQFQNPISHLEMQSCPNNIGTDERQTKFDLSLTIHYDEYANTFGCILDGSCDLFNEKTVQDLSHRFHILCQQLFSSSSFDLKKQPIYELSIILPIEQDIMKQLNNSVITSNIPLCIHQVFVQQAMIYPNKIAITLDQQSLTYSQLLTQVQQLSIVLINEKGIKPGDIICQCIDRSIEMIVGIMSIIMSGAIYAPLSLHDPFDRLHSLIRQVNAKLVLINQMSLSHFHQVNVPILDIYEIVNSNNPLNDAQMEQLSKVIVTPDSISHFVFTSGSTGTPKCVQLRHRNFMSYMDAHFIQKNDIILQLASSSFDVHLDEIFSALVRGAHLILLKANGHLDFDYLTKVIHDNNVTFVAPVPSWIDAVSKFLSQNDYAQERIKQVHWWFLGGNKQNKIIYITS
jgi:non-ribosomal peptide synthetase component F